jgi:hypothetical protein
VAKMPVLRMGIVKRSDDINRSARNGCSHGLINRPATQPPQSYFWVTLSIHAAHNNGSPRKDEA